MRSPDEYDEAGYWPYNPAIWTGLHVPLAFEPPAEIETPDYQRVGLGESPSWSPYELRMYGVPFPWGPGLAPHDFEIRRITPADYDREFRQRFPDLSPERIDYRDTQRCVDVDAADLSPAIFRVWEIARLPFLQFGVGIVERIGTQLQVTALDVATGNPLFTFAGLNGEDPCLDQLVHPDPAVLNPLRFRFQLVASGFPTVGAGDGQPTYPPIVVAGGDIVRGAVLESWGDLRNGFAMQWFDFKQYMATQQQLVRLFVRLSGDPDAWRVRVGGRLSGYSHAAGPLGAALRSSTQRTV